MKTCKGRQFILHLSGVTLLGLLGGGFLTGCQIAHPSTTAERQGQSFTVSKGRISALTDFSASLQTDQPMEIKTYVELLDAYDSQLKMPCTFRFEFYDYQPLASNPRGKRLVIWPDFDLTHSRTNNQRWKDYLRSYEFHLPLGFSLQPDKRYILEATCLTGEKRLSDLFKLQFRP